MRLFLIRHGETVDNVACLYAGLRDSALTTHGVLQTRRLASHLSKQAPATSHIFSSNLQRAAKTAEAVWSARGHKENVRQLTQLQEKDFGSGEGTKYGSGSDKPHKGSESAESMQARVDVFLDGHLLPLLQPKVDDDIIVVAHGIILSVLFKRLCGRLSRGAMTMSPDAQRAMNPYPSGGIPVLPSWSNTGYLEATLSPPTPASWEALKLHVTRVNCIDHLAGLRKTRGGIGSARFDEKQRTMDSFFTPKKRKHSDAVE
jgi:probable phosphoglycerate mutase